MRHFCFGLVAGVGLTLITLGVGTWQTYTENWRHFRLSIEDLGELSGDGFLPRPGSSTEDPVDLAGYAFGRDREVVRILRADTKADIRQAEFAHICTRPIEPGLPPGDRPALWHDVQFFLKPEARNRILGLLNENIGQELQVHIGRWIASRGTVDRPAVDRYQDLPADAADFSIALGPLRYHEFEFWYAGLLRYSDLPETIPVCTDRHSQSTG